MPNEHFDRIIDQYKIDGRYRVFNDILRERGRLSSLNLVW